MKKGKSITQEEDFRYLLRSILKNAKEYDRGKYRESLYNLLDYIDNYMIKLENSKKMEAKSVMKLLKKIENNMACCACFTSVKEKN